MKFNFDDTSKLDTCESRSSFNSFILFSYSFILFFNVNISSSFSVNFIFNEDTVSSFNFICDLYFCTDIDVSIEAEVYIA